MTVKVAINGFGRIGRNVLRALYENGYRDRIEVVAINDLGDPSLNAHLLRHDTAHGHFPFKVEHDEESLSVDGDRIAILSERDPASLPWAKLGVDIVMECTGIFKGDKAKVHLGNGSKRVLQFQHGFWIHGASGWRLGFAVSDGQPWWALFEEFGIVVDKEI